MTPRERYMYEAIFEQAVTHSVGNRAAVEYAPKRDQRAKAWFYANLIQPQSGRLISVIVTEEEAQTVSMGLLSKLSLRDLIWTRTEEALKVLERSATL